ncbi:MAG TPA: hypothetical protein VN622_11015 [Clostridia bacterium]|nr:hypothetical protein [Clostridia bacterium]
MTDGQTMVAVTVAVQIISAAIHVGISKRAQTETDRRLENVEGDVMNHEGRISNVEGKLSIAMPARAGR